MCYSNFVDYYKVILNKDKIILKIKNNNMYVWGYVIMYFNVFIKINRISIKFFINNLIIK